MVRFPSLMKGLEFWLQVGGAYPEWGLAHRQYLGQQTVALANWLGTLRTAALRTSESAPTEDMYHPLLSKRNSVPNIPFC